MYSNTLEIRMKRRSKYHNHGKYTSFCTLKPKKQDGTVYKLPYDKYITYLAGKYKLKQRWTTSNFNVEKDIRFC